MCTPCPSHPNTSCKSLNCSAFLCICRTTPFRMHLLAFQGNLHDTSHARSLCGDFPSPRIPRISAHHVSGLHFRLVIDFLITWHAPRWQRQPLILLFPQGTVPDTQVISNHCLSHGQLGTGDTKMDQTWI